MLSQIRRQMPATLRLAAPVAFTQIGYMTMVLVDTYMVGQLGASSIAGVGIGSAVFWGINSFFMGSLMGMDPLVSQAYGRGDMRECREWLVHGCYAAILLSIPLTVLIYLSAWGLPWLGLPLEVESAARQFLIGVGWSSTPFLLFVAFRQYLQAINCVRTPTLIVLIANLVNFVLNWLFVLGRAGFPVLGVAGSSLATSITRTFMFLLILAFTIYLEFKNKGGLSTVSRKWRLDPMKQIFRLGVPAGLQLLFEVAVFSVASILAGRISAVAGAAHTIVINIASLTYMVPFGISAAAAVQVGQAVGAGRLEQARIAGWSALLLAAVCMGTFGITIFVMGESIPRFFTSDLEVVELGAKVLLLASIFQLADGIQSVGTGALRGTGNTRFAMVANFLGYWVFGLPSGCIIAFGIGLGLPGLWIGLTIGLWTVAVLVLTRWSRFRPSKV